ncbi:MAG: hypothetical protein A4E56_00132 [Pelotomaculum sp. PtaU1.Bin065]|nr:MAG: hypothetical protein A4E56_00132 [Pelotomaculum sp. PtaU1.Bin065]
MLHAIWVRHHLRPGLFFDLPRGEQVFLLKSMEIELKPQPKTRLSRKRR